MRYLSVRESVRRLRAAGMPVQARTVLDWVRQRRLTDVWVLGRHTFIYEDEVNALIDGRRG